jgi:GNAT superfamily N-acetyltransferase
MDIRPAGVGDGATLAALLTEYLAESFPGHAGTGAAALEQDVLSGASGLRVVFAEARGVPLGFAAWHRVYDLHWAKGGAELSDLYVAPLHRGLGVALALAAAVCDAALGEGLTYLRGTSFERVSPAGRFYERIAVAVDSAECHCSGRAFRRLAELHGQPPRAIARRLPPKAWNYDP